MWENSAIYFYFHFTLQGYLSRPQNGPKIGSKRKKEENVKTGQLIGEQDNPLPGD